MKIIAVLFVVLFFAFSSNGQTIEELQKKAKAFKKSDKYKITYDKFKDKTIVQTEKYYIPCFGVSVGFVFDGKEMKAQPKDIALMFTAYGSVKGSMCGRGWRFLKDSELILLADDQRFPIGQGSRESDITRGIFGGGPMTVEQMLYAVPVETFEKLSKAKTIEFQIDKEQGKFNPAILEMLKNFYQLTK